MIVIHKPIMRADLGRRFVGVACHKVLQESQAVKIVIDYRRRDGTFLYPHPLYISKSEIVKYPKSVRYGVALYIVPIDKMREAKDEILTGAKLETLTIKQNI